MRWSTTLPKNGTRRIITRFALFPCTIWNDEESYDTLWLEWVYIQQVATTLYYDTRWNDQCFVTRQEWEKQSFRDI